MTEGNFNATSTYKELIEKLLADCDVDIREAMMNDSTTAVYTGGRKYKVFELIDNAPLFIATWQSLREIRRK